MSDYQPANDIVSFSRDLAEVIYLVSQTYPDMYVAAAELTQTPPSPSSEAELLEIRQGAMDMADSIASYSRLITLLEAELQANPVAVQHDPRMTRPLLLDLIESAVLLAHVPSLAELAELSLLTPEEIESRLEHPQIAAWMQHNLTPEAVQEYQISDQVPDPGYLTEPPQYADPNTSYPPLTDSPYPQLDPQPVQDSPYPQLDPNPTIDQPQIAQPPLPGEVAPDQSSPADSPWSGQAPLARPSTEGERTRHQRP